MQRKCCDKFVVQNQVTHKGLIITDIIRSELDNGRLGVKKELGYAIFADKLTCA